jgi:hypothetical protein
MYPSQDENQNYSFEIVRIFGFLSILFAIIPQVSFAGCLMGYVGIYYERKNAKEHDNKYNYVNLGLNAAGMIIGGLYLAYWLIFKLNFFGW